MMDSLGIGGTRGPSSLASLLVISGLGLSGASKEVTVWWCCKEIGQHWQVLV
jgi:hypothetical protein